MRTSSRVHVRGLLPAHRADEPGDLITATSRVDGSARPAAAHAAALRDLLVALEVPSVTIVGHSLGGGIAMQFAYQFPERTSRLILIGSGGLGRELTPMLRAATVPGAETVVGALARLPESLTRRILPIVATVPGLLARQDTGPLAEGLHGLADLRHRHTFVRPARTVIDWRGQTVSATRQLGLLGTLPVLVAWGSDDATIPPHSAVPQFHRTVPVLRDPMAGPPHHSAQSQLT